MCACVSSSFLFSDIAFAISPTYRPLQLELVGNLAGDVLEPDGGAGDPLEPHAVEREPRQLAHLDLPLHQRVRVRVAVDAEQEEALALLVVAVVRVQDLKKKTY